MPNLAAATAESKLRQSRNYQPPRQSRLSRTKSRSQWNREEREGGAGGYEEDFEHESDEEREEEEEEEEEDTDKDVIARQREQWLLEQAVRGRARQRALMEREKESKQQALAPQAGGTLYTSYKEKGWD